MMRRSVCTADMSNPNEQIVQPKRIGKFVTFSQECDNPKKDHENTIVFPKTKIPDKVDEVVFRKYSYSPRFPQADEVIDLPFSEHELSEETISNEDGKPSSSQKSIPCNGKRTTLHTFNTSSNRHIKRRHSTNRTNGINIFEQKLKRIYQLKQMDHLTALCKEKMSISTKETEKMDEDSSD